MIINRRCIGRYQRKASHSSPSKQKGRILKMEPSLFGDNSTTDAYSLDFADPFGRLTPARCHTSIKRTDPEAAYLSFVSL